MKPGIIDRLFGRFERRIDPFARDVDAMPPTTVAGFYVFYLRQIWPSLCALTVVGLATALIEVSLFDFLGRIVDWVASPPADFFRQHGVALTWMAFTALIARPLVFGLHDLLKDQSISPSLTTLIRWQTHRYVLRQSLAFFQNDFAGRIANRVMQTGHALRESAMQTVDAIWFVIVYAGSALVLFAQADRRLALPLLLWIVAYVAALRYFLPRVQARAAMSAEANSRLMGRVVDGYTNAATLKLFAHTRLEEDYARAAMAEQTKASRLAGRIVTGMDFCVTTLNGLLVVSTAGLALWLWRGGSVTTGAIALSIGLCIRITNMSGWIMWVISGVFENIGTVSDGMATICVPHEVTDRAGASALAVPGGEILFEDVRFHYGRGERVIDGLQIRIAAGERIGLLGPSGAGKSTCVNLLLRLYDVESGRILIDGQDIAEVTQESLRARIGIVTQDTSLLHRSIRENLLYGAPDASEAAVWAAVEQARAHEFIDSLVDGEGRRGLDAHVGERGVKLSGGQRQRIAIARVLLKDAPILILDEATSALDSEVEAVIQESLDVLMQRKTVIVIAHRLSTIARLDRLVVLDLGRIVESGSHAELVAARGLYARLWQRQTGGFIGV